MCRLIKIRIVYPRMLLAGFFLLLLLPGLQAQDSGPKDNSKPTNVYSQVDNYLEATIFQGYKTFGYSPQFTYTPNEDHALILQVPLLFST